MTIEEYLREDHQRNVIEHTIRVSIVDDKVEFYIHPTSIDGKTIDFIVEGNTLTTKFVTQ
jgi:hypothetical protein